MSDTGDIKKNKTAKRKADLLVALEKSHGIVTDACRMAGTSRKTYYQYLKEDKQFAKEVKEIDEVAKDFVESKLYQKISNGDTTAIIFYCKTKMKDRGYIERVETKDLSPPTIIIKENRHYDK